MSNVPFYVIWSAILVVGDGLCWGTADYFWTHNYFGEGDFCIWLLWAISVFSIAKIILKK
jgi:hypothetical protein